MKAVHFRVQLTKSERAIPPVFIVAADESQRMHGEKLAQSLKENGIDAQGVDIINSAKDAKLLLQRTRDSLLEGGK
jgi:hypothetical protein